MPENDVCVPLALHAASKVAREFTAALRARLRNVKAGSGSRFEADSETSKRLTGVTLLVTGATLLVTGALLLVTRRI